MPVAQEAIRKEPGSAPVTNPIRFQGQSHDHETGLHYNQYAYVPSPVGWIDPLRLARAGQWTTIGNGRIRIDPPHVPNTNQQVHAPCQCRSRKQEVVVNKDGAQSHGSSGDVSGLTRTEKDCLRDKGFDL